MPVADRFGASQVGGSSKRTLARCSKDRSWAPRLQLIRIRPNRPYLEFSKTLTDPATGLTRNAITYQRRLAFSDADNRTQVSDLLDTFIADYLRVNEEAC